MRRAQNLHYILEGVQNFYAVTLEQVVIMRLPDLLAICKDPENDESLYEMEKMLLLLLGCSVQVWYDSMSQTVSYGYVSIVLAYDF
jgi:hypothetical protein